MDRWSLWTGLGHNITIKIHEKVCFWDGLVDQVWHYAISAYDIARFCFLAVDGCLCFTWFSLILVTLPRAGQSKYERNERQRCERVSERERERKLQTNVKLCEPVVSLYNINGLNLISIQLLLLNRFFQKILVIIKLIFAIFQLI